MEKRVLADGRVLSRVWDFDARTNKRMTHNGTVRRGDTAYNRGLPETMREEKPEQLGRGQKEGTERQGEITAAAHFF